VAQSNVEYSWRPGIVEKYVETNRSSLPQIVVMKPGGSGGAIVSTPRSPSAASAPVAESTSLTSYP
jgi:hypothetical protein